MSCEPSPYFARPGAWSDVCHTHGLNPRLFHYPAGYRQSSHVHSTPHLSVLMAGSFLEEGRADTELHVHGTGILRAESSRHAVTMGPAGALIFSVDVTADLAVQYNRSGSHVLRSSKSLVQLMSMIRGKADGSIGHSKTGAVPSTAQVSLKNDAPPEWLRQFAHALMNRPCGSGIGALAELASVDRTQLSRQFKYHYGLPPSVFRRRAMVAYALNAILVERDALADAATGAGFTDQSHLSRATNELCGFPPGQLRKLFTSRVTSIQS